MIYEILVGIAMNVAKWSVVQELTGNMASCLYWKCMRQINSLSWEVSKYESVVNMCFVCMETC